jgi:hypothetical protein
MLPLVGAAKFAVRFPPKSTKFGAVMKKVTPVPLAEALPVNLKSTRTNGRNYVMSANLSASWKGARNWHRRIMIFMIRN